MMGPAVQLPERDTGGWPLLLGFLAVSALAHVVTFVVLPSTAPPRGPAHTVVEMDLYEPPPPPPPKVEEPEPPKELEKPKPKPVVKVETPRPPEDVPPPPNEEPPPQPTKPVPLVVGVTMSSTAVGGSFAVPVGNTTYGKADKVVDPAEVKPYAAPKYAPPGSADAEPELLGEVKIPYPDDAQKNGVEGSVRLKVTLDAQGLVEQVVVLSGPGYGLNEAARDALRRFHFRPAMKAGEAVGYTFVYTYTFLLD